MNSCRPPFLTCKFLKRSILSLLLCDKVEPFMRFKLNLWSWKIVHYWEVNGEKKEKRWAKISRISNRKAVTVASSLISFSSSSFFKHILSSCTPCFRTIARFFVLNLICSSSLRDTYQETKLRSHTSVSIHFNASLISLPSHPSWEILLLLPSLAFVWASGSRYSTVCSKLSPSLPR